MLGPLLTRISLVSGVQKGTELTLQRLNFHLGIPPPFLLSSFPPFFPSLCSSVEYTAHTTNRPSSYLVCRWTARVSTDEHPRQEQTVSGFCRCCCNWELSVSKKCLSPFKTMRLLFLFQKASL